MDKGGGGGGGSPNHVPYLEANVSTSLPPLSLIQTMHMHISNDASPPFRSVGPAHEVDPRTRERERERARV